MVTFGEDSLNEETEDEGLALPGEDEPTVEQLVATGEIDINELTADVQKRVRKALGGDFLETPPEKSISKDINKEREELEGPEDEYTEEDMEEPGTAMVPSDISSLSVRKQVDTLLRNGVSRDELEEMGYNKNTIRTVASELKTKAGSNRPVGRKAAATASGMPAFAKGVPPELIIDAVHVPDISGGGSDIFGSGMKFGLSVAVLGIRMAQELSGIGIQQAKPIIDMAKNMREDAAIASKNAAEEAATESAAMVLDQLGPALQILKDSTPSQHVSAGGDPMKDMMAKTMQPLLQNLMSNAMSKLIPGSPAPQLNGPGVDGWNVKEE